MLSCCETEKTLCSVLERCGFWDDRKIALWFWDGHRPLRYQRKVSKKELRESAYGFASSLIKKFGVGRGEPIAIILPNIPEFAVAYFGIWFAGCMAVPLNPRLSIYELSLIIKGAGIKRVVVLDKIYPEISGIETLENIIIVRMSGSFPFIKSFAYISKAIKQNIFVGIPKDDKRAFDFKQLLKNGKKNPSLYFPRIRPESNALMLFTSGTTSSPKGVVHTHKSLMNNAIACKSLLFELLGGDDFKNETFLAAAPYFHIMGLSTMLHTPLLAGSKIITIFPFPGEDFGDKLLSAVSYAKASIFVGAPRFYDIMLVSFQKSWKWKWFDFSCLKICISGSVEMPKNLREKFQKEFGKNIIEGYGMSESGISHCQKRDFNSVGSVGSVLPGVEHKILDPNEDGRGEILVKSKGLMRGYLADGTVKNGKKFEIFIDHDGWLHTADLGQINEKGELFLTGRKRYIIKTKHGEIIYPIDIERVICSHNLVKEADVVGRKDTDGDYEEVVAFVVLKDKLCEEYSYDEYNKLENDLREYCKSKLSLFEIPRKINFIAELPKNIFGKVLKQELQ